MRTFLVTVLLLSVIACASRTSVASRPDVDVTVDVYSKYIWRGFNLGDDTVLQPSLGIAGEHLSLTVFGNYDTGAGDEWTELDYTLEYGFLVGENEGVVGWTYYTFPNLPDGDGDSSQEVYAGLTWPGRVPLSLTVYYDYDEGDGIYAEVGTEVPVQMGDGEGALSLALGYNRHQWRSESGLSHVLVTLSREFSVGRVSLTPVLGFSAALDADFDSESYFGLSFGVPLHRGDGR